MFLETLYFNLFFLNKPKWNISPRVVHLTQGVQKRTSRQNYC